MIMQFKTIPIPGTNESHIVPEDEVLKHNYEYLQCKCKPVIDKSNSKDIRICHNSLLHK